MKRIHQALTLCSLAIVVFALIFAVSCGHPQSLQSITISPTSDTVAGLSSAPPAGAQAQFIAYGHFIHPIKTVDISSQVTWTSNVPAVAVVNTSPQPNPGLATSTGLGCGSTLITATAGKGVIGPGSSDEIVTGTATFTVNGSNGCAGTQPALAVAFGGAGSGNVTGPSGINCTSTAGTSSGTCAANFTAGTQVILTETPLSGSTFGGWNNCITLTATTCLATVGSTTQNTPTVIATFQ